MKKHSINKDLYEDVIAEPSDGWRVVLSVSGTKWILQKRHERPDGKFRWDDVRAHGVKSDLIVAIRHLVPNPDADAMEIIHDLPEQLTE